MINSDNFQYLQPFFRGGGVEWLGGEEHDISKVIMIRPFDYF